MNKDFPCKCGHIGVEHTSFLCSMCIKNGVIGSRFRIAVHKFKPDNLKYFLKKYETK